MTFDIKIDMFILWVSIAFRIAAGVIFILWVIPPQIAEARVNDALKPLRRQLLVSGVTLFFLNTLGLIILPIRLYGSDATYIMLTQTLTVVNSFAFFIVAWIKYKIYHQAYYSEPPSQRIHKMSHSRKKHKV